MATKVLFEEGDRLPTLELVEAGKVRRGAVVWGIQAEPNLRKGFMLDTEGTVCELGAIPIGEGQLVRVNLWPAMLPDRMILVEVEPSD